ncbi:MAG: DUF2185 domain-containing protein [Lachnospiraceae bacterium]|nr:DUF2185 domain-containing protein [Lachnospiraceae bacterium]
MEMILKVFVRLALIPVAVWGIQLIIAFVQGIREGIQEDREEKRQEELKKAVMLKEGPIEDVKNEMMDEALQTLPEKEAPLLVQVAIAFACPFRYVQISSNGEGMPHLHQLGCLDDEEKESLKKILTRDFDFVFDVEDFDSVGIQMLDTLSRLDKNNWGDAMTTSIALHVITACADLGYIQFDDYINLVSYFMRKIMKYNLQSWKEFADEFLREEKDSGLNGLLGRMLLKYQTGRLLEREDSPWVKIPWESITDIHLEKQFIMPLLNPKEYLTDWEDGMICIVSDRISVDGCKVGYMYRNESLDTLNSGWEFWEGNESEEYRMNWGNAESFSLKVICNYAPDIVPYLNEPYGSIFRRDESGKFQKVDVQ